MCLRARCIWDVGDDQEKFPTFPVANGDVTEATSQTETSTASIDDCPDGLKDSPNDLATTIEEVQISSTRPTTFLGNDDVYPGGIDGETSGNT